MSEIESRRENSNQDPLVFRAHHLKLIRPLLVGGYGFDGIASPTQLAKSIRIDTQKAPQTDYVQDVLGPSSETAYGYETNATRVFETLLSLPKDYPVDLVEGIPDIICKGCVIGDHCRQRYPYPLTFNTDQLESDGWSLDAFIETVNSLNLPKPTITTEQVCFSDAKPQEARRLKTTIDVIERVLVSTTNFYLSGLRRNLDIKPKKNYKK